MTTSAYQAGHRTLYHWQKFDAERLAKTLSEMVIYCSCPAEFNDPWDCKPFYSVEILDDEAERKKHAEWAVDLCRRRTPMSEQDIAIMRETLLTDVARAKALMRDMTDPIVQAILQQYRVYCLGPDLGNLLMWSR